MGFFPSKNFILKSQKVKRKEIFVTNDAPTNTNKNEITNEETNATFLPPNITSFYQPIDQCVNEILYKNIDVEFLSQDVI